MRDTELLQAAFGLLPPWMVARSTFDAAARRLDIHLDFPPGSRFGCPDCGAADCPAYDTEEMTWRHLNFFQHETYLHARVPRVTCSGCGIKRVSVPWAREGSGFTLLFEALAMTMMTSMPVAAVGRLVGEHDTRLWRVLHHYVEEARADADHSGVTRSPSTRPPHAGATITSACSSILMGRGSCLSPMARTPPPSRRSPPTSRITTVRLKT